MKTSVTMIRKMGDFEIHQRTKDGMFNATSLLKQYNNGKRGKEVNAFLKNSSTIEFIESLQESEELDTRNIVSVCKGGNSNNQGTWMHPYLFIDFAMWINPKFKVSVIKFVYDELIKSRHNAGDNYRLLSESGVKLKGYNFSEVATAMNWIVFDKKGKNLRQTATQEQLKELSDIQTKLSFAIDMKYITSYPQLICEMQEMYRIKKRKTPF
jgi:hypothetical protein